MVLTLGSLVDNDRVLSIATSKNFLSTQSISR